MAKKIDYNARNFAQVRTELVGFIKQYYPEIFSDFNDASVGMMLLELNAAVGDMLSFHTDRMFNETQINYAQERSSLLELARTFGLNIPGKRPSITIVDWSVTVPVKGDTFDISYFYHDNENPFLNRISTCYLTSMDVDYGGEKYVTYEPTTLNGQSGPPPQRTNISLAFTEIETITRERAEQGF